MGELSALDRATMAQSVAQTNWEAITRIFSSSQELDRESILDLIHAVCQVSTLELKEVPYRLFMLEKLSIVAHMNMTRPRYIWVSIWEIVGDHLRYVASSPLLDLACVGINILRQLTQKFLEQPELTQFHFQRHFMAPFLQIFEKQQLLEAREYILENIEGLVRESAPRIQSGWSVIFELLGMSIADPATHKGTFNVVSLIVNEWLDVMAPHLADLLTLLSAFVQRAEIELREIAVTCFAKIASKLEKDHATNWFILFEALARSSENDVDSVRRMGHGAMLQITTEMGLTDEIMKNAFDEALPQFFSAAYLAENDPLYYISAAAFQDLLFKRLIAPNWPRLAPLFPQSIELVVNNILRRNDDFTQSSLKALWEFITPVYRGLSEEHQEVLFRELLRVARSIGTLSIPNGQDFLTGLSTLQRESTDERRFIDVFSTATAACAERKYYILWASARAITLQVMLRYGEILTDSIVHWLDTTIRLFLQTEFPYEISSPEAVAWNDAVVASMVEFNAMDAKLFDACFSQACVGLLEMINANNVDVRKQINITMQKRLL
jgi:hypothetical protein